MYNMNYYNTSYLMHHGILGMKWGVRRYQNRDGTLTAAGKQKFKDVKSSKKKQERDTQRAIASYTKMADSANMTANQQALLAKIFGSKKRKKMASDYRATANYANKKLSDITSGKLIAGKDFIVQRDYNYSPIPLLNLTSMSTTSPLSTKNNKIKTHDATIGEAYVNGLIGVYVKDTVINKKRE